MSLALLRSEPCLRTLRWNLPVVLVSGALLGRLVFGSGIPGLTREAPGYEDLVGLWTPLLFAWFSSFAFVALRAKVRPHEEPLPVTPRTLLASHCAALFVSLALPLVAFALATLVATKVSARAPTAAVAASGLALAAALALLPFAWRPAARFTSKMELVVLVGLGLGLVSLVRYPWCAAVYVPVALALGLRFWLATPLAFAQEERPTEVRSERPSLRGFDGVAPLGLVLWRSTLLRPHALGLLVMMVFAMATAEINLFLAFWFVWQGPWLLTRLGLSVLNGLDALPVSRARLIVPVLVPPLLALWLGVGLGRFVQREPPRWSGLASEVHLDAHTLHRLGADGDYANHVAGPASLWQLQWSAEPLVVTAPWGESARMTPRPVFWGLDLALVNPYDVEPTSSVRFLGWQLARAVEATTGVRVPEQELLAPYRARSTHAEPEVVAHLTARDAAPLVLPPVQPGPMPGALALLGVTLAWGLVVLLVLCGSVPPATRAAWRLRLAGRVLTIALLAGAFVAYFAVELQDRVVPRALASLLARGLDARLGSSPLGWGLLLFALVTLVLTLARRSLVRAEVPPPPKLGWRQQPASVF